MRRANKIPLFTVAESGPQIQGMASSVDSAALAPGQWANIQNFRWDGVALKVRGGLSEFIATTGLVSGTVVGALLDSDAGNYVAVNNGSEVRVYRYTAGAWAEITGSGNRFANVSRVWFEKINVPQINPSSGWVNALSGQSYVLVQDGSQVKAVSAPTASGPGTTAMVSVAAVSPPVKCQAVPYSMAYVDIPATSTFTNSSTSTVGSRQTLTTTSGGTTTTIGSYMQIALSTGSAASHTVAFGTSLNLTTSVTSSPAQLQIVYGGSNSLIWDFLRVEIYNGSTWYIIHDPTITEYQTAATGSDRYYAAMFSCASVYTATTGSAISFPSMTATQMRFTYVGASSPNAAYNIPIFAIAYGGDVNWGTQFGVSLWDSSKCAESPGVVCENMPSPGMTLVGGTPVQGLTLANSPLAKYSYNIKFTVPTTGSVYSVAYARNGREYKSVALTSHSISAAGEQKTQALHRLSFSRWVMPPPESSSIPAGGPMASTGDRLFVAAVESGKRTRVGFSERGYPHRFALAPQVVDNQVVPRSGGLAIFPDETVNAITPMPGNVGGSDTVIVNTTKAVYQMAGVDALQLSKPNNLGLYGCTAPGSVARFKNTLIWVSPEREVITLGGELGDISSRLVEDVLHGVPVARIDDIESIVYRQRLYIGYTPSGGSKNTNALVFDSRTGGWSVDFIDTNSNASFAKWARHVVSGEERFVCFDTTGWAFEYDLPGTAGDRAVTATTTSEPTIRLTSKTLSQGFFEQLRVTAIGMVADTQTGKTLTTSVIERSTGASATGTISLDGGANLLSWQFNRGTSSTAERPGSIGLGHQIDITGQMAPGKKIYAITADVEPQTTDGAKRP